MLLRRIIEHLRTQNWVAIAIDLVVVVVGVFLAFQVERLYETRRLQSEEESHLLALAEDFASSRAELERVIDIHTTSINAAVTLLRQTEGNSANIDHDQFYTLLADVQRTGTPNVTRRTYDFLIASGDIDTLRDDILKAKMAAFFALFDGRGDYMIVELRNYSSMTFTPYVNEHLDHVALAQKMHPNDTSMLTPTLPMDQFHNVLGDGEFEGVITTKWHLSLDYRRNNQTMLRQVEDVEQELTENLVRFATELSSD